MRYTVVPYGYNGLNRGFPGIYSGNPFMAQGYHRTLLVKSSRTQSTECIYTKALYRRVHVLKKVFTCFYAWQAGLRRFFKSPKKYFVDNERVYVV